MQVPQGGPRPMHQASEDLARIAREGYLAQLKQLPAFQSEPESGDFFKRVDHIIDAAVMRLQALYKQAFDEEVLPEAIRNGRGLIVVSDTEGPYCMQSPFMLSPKQQGPPTLSGPEGSNHISSHLEVGHLPKLPSGVGPLHDMGTEVDSSAKVLSSLSNQPSASSQLWMQGSSSGWMKNRSSICGRRLTNNSDYDGSPVVSNTASDTATPSYNALNMRMSGQSDTSQHRGLVDSNQQFNYVHQRLQEAFGMMNNPGNMPNMDPTQHQMLMSPVMQQQQMQQPDLQQLIHNQILSMQSNHRHDPMLLGQSNDSLVSQNWSVCSTDASMASNFSLTQLMAALGSNDPSGPLYPAFRDSSADMLPVQCPSRLNQQMLPARFAPLPLSVQLRIRDLTKPSSVLKISDFDDKVIGKMALMLDRYGENEVLAMLDKLAGRLKTKISAMKNGPGYLDVAVSSHLDVLMAHRFSPQTCRNMKEYARCTLGPAVFEELGKAIEDNPWLRWEVLDESIVHQLKKLPLDIASERLAEVGLRSFRHVDNVSGCIKSILSSRNQYTVRPANRDV